MPAWLEVPIASQRTKTASAARQIEAKRTELDEPLDTAASLVQRREVDARRWGDPVGMEQMGEQLGAVEEARARARVGGGGIDGEGAGGAERLDPLPVRLGFAPRLLRVHAAGHDDDEVGSQRRQPLPLDLGRLRPSRAGDV